MTRQRSAAWSRYWAQGALHSLAGSYAGNYEGEIAAVWRAAFACLKPGDRVLDVGTGNGAIPKLLIDTPGTEAIDCDAVDLAELRPAWLDGLAPATRARLHFHSGVSAERLPFDGQRFALITAQYAVEYTDLDCTIAELLRVRAPAGRIRLVLHHADARPAAVARDEIAQIDWLCDAGRVLDATDDMLRLLRRAQTAAGRQALAQDPKANRSREHFNLLQQALSERIAAAGPGAALLVDVRADLGRLIQAATTGAGDPQDGLKRLRLALADARLRLDELLRHALSAPDMERLAQRFRDAGLSICTGTVADRGHLMGWLLDALPA